MSEFFSKQQEIYSASAPGRLDVMGGISDYSGSLLLQMPIKQTTKVSIQERKDTMIHIRSNSAKKKADEFVMDSLELVGKDYASISKQLKSIPGGDWAIYIIGSIAVLAKEKAMPLKGLNIEVESKVPVGKGVSSSAALEVATMCALGQLFNLSFKKTELPLLAQKAENLVVGAPCGLMDQLSSYLGKKNRLLPLVCQPHTVMDTIPIPAALSFCAIDSGIRHAVSGASYGDVRTAAFMAYTIIAMAEGATETSLKEARETNDWSNLPYGGFLSNISPSLFDIRYRSLLPETMRGSEFFEKYKVSIDKVTTINPTATYYLVNCAFHPIGENFRIQNFLTLLNQFGKAKDKESVLKLMGEMMFQSHASYSSVGLGNTHTDEIVEMVRKAGPAAGVYGARITGGGSGGTVCVLYAGKKGKETVKTLFEEYRSKHGIDSFFFEGSSDGARMLNQ